MIVLVEKKDYDELVAKVSLLEKQLGEIAGLRMRVAALELANTKYGQTNPPSWPQPHWPITMPQQPVYVGDPIPNPYEVTCGVAQGKA